MTATGGQPEMDEYFIQSRARILSYEARKSARYQAVGLAWLRLAAVRAAERKHADLVARLHREIMKIKEASCK
jgi:hypothetical protein